MPNVWRHDCLGAFERTVPQVVCLIWYAKFSQQRKAGLPISEVRCINRPVDQAPRRQAPSLDQVRANFPNLEVIELIGHGGMGAVYLARQKQLDRLVALKILPAEFAERPVSTERFQREGQMLARLDHPNIVRVYEFGQSSDFHYLLLEYVDGVNLRALCKPRSSRRPKGWRSFPNLRGVAIRTRRRILHRDIKPENILIDTRGRVKITDFGIAKFQDVS